MAYRALFLSSDLGDGTPQNFTTRFSPPIDLNDGGDYAIALDNVSHIYSWYNIADKYNNRTLKYIDSTGPTTYTLTLNEGQYSIELLNDALHNEMYDNGHYTTTGGVITYPIDIVADFATGKVKVIINDGNFELDLQTDDLNELLGFTKKVVVATELGSSPANINNGVVGLLLHADIADGVYSGKYAGNAITSYLPNNYPFFTINYKPYNHVWVPISKKYIESINIRFTDQNNNELDLNGEALSCTLLIKKV